MQNSRKQSADFKIAFENARAFHGSRNKDWQPIIMKLGDIDPSTPLPDLEMCLVPSGKFMMGGTIFADEAPIHEQIIQKPYWIARYPVTNSQWRLAVQASIVNEPRDFTYRDGTNPIKWYNDSTMSDCPVVAINWFQSLKFAKWAKCKLPTEPLWEFAARGIENWIYPWGNEWDKGIHAIWYSNYEQQQPEKITSKPTGVSWVGAKHMSGNVWEWQLSEYGKYPYKVYDGREKDSRHVNRVLRGGSWRNDIHEYFRSACRSFGKASDRFVNWGLRLCIF